MDVTVRPRPAASDRPVLALADLEMFDPTAPAGKVERDFCCPLPGCDGKSVNVAHRSLSVNSVTGRWTCHRCHASGTLREHWQPRKEFPRAAVLRAFRVKPPVARQPAPPLPQAWMPAMVDAVPLEGTWGARYLEGRGISCALATAAGVRYSSNWYGQSAVLFPVLDRLGRMVGVNGRHINPTVTPKTRSAGKISGGVFQTTGALDAEQLVITEAPIDALSLATVGIPAVALCGTHAPEWLQIGFRRVVLAFDTDEAGDQAAAALRPILESFGIRVERWRPPVGKDWNEALMVSALFSVPRAQGRNPEQGPDVSMANPPTPAVDPVVDVPGVVCNWDGCNERVGLVHLHDGTEELRCGSSHAQGWEPVREIRAAARPVPSAHRALDTKRTEILTWAEEHGWPRLSLAHGTALPGGERSWRGTVHDVSPRSIAAIAAAIVKDSAGGSEHHM